MSQNCVGKRRAVVTERPLLDDGRAAERTPNGDTPQRPRRAPELPFDDRDVVHGSRLLTRGRAVSPGSVPCRGTPCARCATEPGGSRRVPLTAEKNTTVPTALARSRVLTAYRQRAAATHRSQKVAKLAQSCHGHVTHSPVSSVVEGGGCGPTQIRAGVRPEALDWPSRARRLAGGRACPTLPRAAPAGGWSLAAAASAGRCCRARARPLVRLTLARARPAR